MHCKFSKVNMCTNSNNITFNTRKHRKEGNLTQENVNDITNKLLMSVRWKLKYKR